MYLPWILTLVVCFTISSAQDNYCQFEGWDDYLNTWRTRFATEAKKLYPFGEWFCDTNATYQGKSLGFNPGVTVPVYYYGVKYNSAWVGPSGIISFNESSTPLPIGYTFRDTWPNLDYPSAPDPPFLAPFYSEADMDPLNAQDASAFSYRVLDPGDTTKPLHEQEITAGMLDHLTQEVRLSVVGANAFVAKYGLVVTWYKVKFDGALCSDDDCHRNTYQVALVVDGPDTYVIYNYFSIEWVGGSGYQQCDHFTGLVSSESTNCKPAHIGFNAGYGRAFTALPYSNDQAKTKDMDILQGSNVTGRFIYKVSEDRIVRGGCTNDTSLDNAAWPLEMSPLYTDMLGGGAVEVSAPCFHQKNLDNAKCKFGNIEREPVPYADTQQKAKCVPPALDIVGATMLQLSTDGGNYYRYMRPIIINLIGRNEYQVHIDNPSNDWLNPDHLPLSWDPAELGGDSVSVDIRLLGYREDGDPGKAEGIWELLEITDTMLDNTGSYVIQTNAVQCGQRNADYDTCLLYDVGVIQVSVHREDPNPPRTLSSEVIPLGWYVKTALEQEHGGKWLETKCQDWVYLESKYEGWKDESHLVPCPCTLQQALADWGRFQPDVHCNMFSTNAHGCKYYEEAVHCVLSTYVTPNQGSGSRCCYNAQHNLQYAGDLPQGGSHSDRSHESGLWPYEMPPRVPSLSHWVRDMAPWFYCCDWQEKKDDCHEKYLPRRKTPDCRTYEPPGFGFSFGDPHYITLDGTEYTFNGHGEFWLLLAEGVKLEGESVDIKVQVRTTQPPRGQYGEVLATFTTAVTVSLTPQGEWTEADIVTFMVDEFFEHSDNKLQVMVSNTLLEFDHHGARVQEFKDFILVNHDPPESKASTNFTLAYRLGFGVQVSFSHGLIQTIVSAPKELMDPEGTDSTTTVGLLGRWNGAPGDDLRPRDWLTGSVSPNNTQNVHEDFGMSWLVRQEESMFMHTYRAELDYNFYLKEDFVPIFDPDGTEPSPNVTKVVTFEQVLDVCGGNEFCYYDYTVTGNEALATQTLWMHEWALGLKQQARKVLSCGHLDIRNSIKQEPFDYLVGSTVVIEGCREGYSLEGTKQYTCLDAGSGQAVWDPPISTRCKGHGTGLSIAALTAISVTLALVFFFIVIAIIICVLYIYKRRTAGKPTKPAEMDSNIIDTSLTDTDWLRAPPAKYKGKPRPAVDSSFEHPQSGAESDIEKPRHYDSDYMNIGDGAQGNSPKAKPRTPKMQPKAERSVSIDNDKRKSSSDETPPKAISQTPNPYISMDQSPDRRKPQKTKNQARQEQIPMTHSPSSSHKSGLNSSRDTDTGRVPSGLTPPQSRRNLPAAYEYQPSRSQYQYPNATYQYPNTSTLKSTYSAQADGQKRKPPYQYPNRQMASALDANPNAYQGRQNYRSQPRKPPYVYPSSQR